MISSAPETNERMIRNIVEKFSGEVLFNFLSHLDPLSSDMFNKVNGNENSH